MNQTYKIRRVGGCLMVTIPQQIQRVMSLKEGSEVKIGLVNIGSGGTITIEPQRKPKGKSK